MRSSGINRPDIARQQDNQAKITEIYTDLKVVLVRDKKYR